MRRVVESLVDGESILPWGDRYGKSLLTCFARFEGEPVGVVASQPIQRAGVLDVPALRKEARFVDLCDTFNLPLVFLQDIPGLMIGTDAERAGILRAYEEVVTRLSRGRSAEDRGDRPQGLRRRPHRARRPAGQTRPVARLARGRDGLHGAGNRREDRAPSQTRPGRAGGGAGGTRRAAGRLEEEWAAESQPWEAAANIILDDIIEPTETRERIISGIDFAWGSRVRVTEGGLSVNASSRRRNLRRHGLRSVAVTSSDVILCKDGAWRVETAAEAKNGANGASRTPRRRDGDVLEAAVKVFYERGYSDATVQDVADELGILKGSLYHYIETKEDLLFQLVEEVHAQVEAILDEVKAEEGLEPLERLELYVRRQVEYNLENLERISIYYHDLDPPHRRSARLRQASRRVHDDFVTGLIAAAQKEGKADKAFDARMMANCVFGDDHLDLPVVPPGPDVAQDRRRGLRPPRTSRRRRLVRQRGKSTHRLVGVISGR